MTGIVVVSHSGALADAAIALAREMSGDVPMVAAAGIAEGFGTDATAIASAMSAADDGQGVVVLMDLGSAILSSEMALEFLEPELRERVILCAAPFVEGLVAAAVSAAGGASPAQVCHQAASALEPKKAGLTSEAATYSFVLTNEHGLHARPAARLVGAIRGFDARIDLRNATRNSEWVPADSLTQVALLGGQPGDEIEVRAAGQQSSEAVESILTLAGEGFGDTEIDATHETVTGRVWQYRRIAVPHPMPGSAEQERLDRARAAAAAELRTVRDQLPTAVRAIFNAHIAFLDDLALIRRARVSITVGDSAEDAWSQAVDATVADFARIQDPYLRARAADVRAIGDSVMRALAETELPSGRGIVIAPELNPVEAGSFEVEAAVLTDASDTDHAVMILRARGIPVVVAADPSVLTLPDDTAVTVDTGTGKVTP